MKKHIKAYFEGMGITPTASFDDMFIACEWCGARAVDVHHIYGRGSGGSKLLDVAPNLAALCRDCHLKAEARTIPRGELLERHIKNMR